MYLIYCLYYSSICLYTCNSPILPDCVSHTFPCITHPLTLIVAFLHTYFVVLLVNLSVYITNLLILLSTHVHTQHFPAYSLMWYCALFPGYITHQFAFSFKYVPIYICAFNYNHLLWEYFFCLPEYIEHCLVQSPVSLGTHPFAFEFLQQHLSLNPVHHIHHGGACRVVLGYQLLLFLDPPGLLLPVQWAGPLCVHTVKMKSRRSINNRIIFSSLMHCRYDSSFFWLYFFVYLDSVTVLIIL